MSKKDFNKLYKDEVWRAVCPCCEEIVSGKPHYRDAQCENDYFICPICSKKLYIGD